MQFFSNFGNRVANFANYFPFSSRMVSVILPSWQFLLTFMLPTTGRTVVSSQAKKSFDIISKNKSCPVISDDVSINNSAKIVT